MSAGKPARIFMAMSLALTCARAQFLSTEETPYASASTPTGIGGEDLLVFEARPIVNYHFYDDMKDRIQNAHRWAQDYYLGFDPHIRMYNTTSVPVRMPSYRVFLSGTALWVWGDKDVHNVISSATVQHGHYSNGQEGCAFGSSTDRDSLCKEKYRSLDTLDFGKELNRRNGEFSTDFWRLKLKHVWFNYQEDGKRERLAWEFTGSGTYWVDRILFGIDMGGYKHADASFYPIWQLGAEGATHLFCEGACIDLPLPFTSKRMRFGKDVKLSLEYYYKPSDSPQINPHLFSPSLMMFMKSGMGFMVKGEFGQDPYNLRFVDSIRRGLIALVWHISTPWQIEKSTEGSFDKTGEAFGS